MVEPITGRRFKNFMAQGITVEYKDIKLMMNRDSSFDLKQIQIQSTMRHLYLDNP